LFAVAMALRHVVVANTDVSWLLIGGERVLDGERLYADILKTNPPMSVLVYIPAILIARALGLPAEIVVDGLPFVAVAISLTIVSALLMNSSSVLGRVQRWRFLILAAAVLTILPGQAFGQREHIAAVELLPALAVLATRINRERPAAWAVAIAGLGLGLALSFKPYFAIAVLFWVGLLAIHLRCRRVVLATEYFVAAAIVGLNGVCTLLLFPEYFTVIGPIVRDVYIPTGPPAARMIEKPVVPLRGIALIAALLVMRRVIDPTHLMLIAASIGFGIVVFVQRRGWPYHSYPMMVFALLALDYAIQSAGKRVGRGIAAGGVLLAALFIASMVWFDHAFDARSLEAAVAPLGPHPTILAISAQAGLGHPLTRAVGGVWASRQQGLLINGYYKYVLDNGSPDQRTIALLDGYAFARM
jgi:hypothetical protein